MSAWAQFLDSTAELDDAEIMGEFLVQLGQRSGLDLYQFAEGLYRRGFRPVDMENIYKEGNGE